MRLAVFDLQDDAWMQQHWAARRDVFVLPADDDVDCCFVEEKKQSLVEEILDAFDHQVHDEIPYHRQKGAVVVNVCVHHSSGLMHSGGQGSIEEILPFWLWEAQWMILA